VSIRSCMARCSFRGTISLLRSRPPPAGPAGQTPGEFDFYVLSLSVAVVLRGGLKRGNSGRSAAFAKACGRPFSLCSVTACGRNITRLRYCQRPSRGSPQHHDPYRFWTDAGAPADSSMNGTSNAPVRGCRARGLIRDHRARPVSADGKSPTSLLHCRAETRISPAISRCLHPKVNNRA